MDEEPTLPAPVRGSSIGRILDEYDGNPAKKRVRYSSPVPAFSSDPPLFSSDDDPSVENYTKKRQKKTYRGPWYRQQLASDPESESNDKQPTKGKRKLERQFDSGVWLGSEGTEPDDTFEEDLAVIGVNSEKSGSLSPGLHVALGGMRRLLHGSPEELADSAGPSHLARGMGSLSRPDKIPEELAREVIHDCLEHSMETINLSSQQLTSLSNETIEPLSTFTCTQRIGSVRFESLVPNLELYLGSNFLTTLPGAMFDLDRLTVLSLRGNQLQELPPGIGKLHNLKELNISQNRLNFLPYEILELVSDAGNLRNFQIHPNPFWELLKPDDDTRENSQRTLKGECHVSLPGSSHSLGSQRSSSKWQLSFKFRTQTRFRDLSGNKLIKGPVFPLDTPQELSLLPVSASRIPVSGTELPVANADDIPAPPPPRGAYLSRAPSLLEVALNAVSKTRMFSYIDDFLPEDTPEHILNLLAKATTSKETGGSQCTICGRDFIIARTEWVEWWEIAKEQGNKGTASAASPLRQMENTRDSAESMVPLIRRGCSWLCTPGKEETIVEEHDNSTKDEERSMDLD